MINGDNQLGITGQRPSVPLSTGISAGLIWRGTDSWVEGWGAEEDGGDNGTLGTQTWGLQPGELGGNLKASLVQMSHWVSVWKVPPLSVYRLWESWGCLLWPLGCLNQHGATSKAWLLLEVQSKPS